MDQESHKRQHKCQQQKRQQLYHTNVINKKRHISRATQTATIKTPILGKSFR